MNFENIFFPATLEHQPELKRKKKVNLMSFYINKSDYYLHNAREVVEAALEKHITNKSNQIIDKVEAHIGEASERLAKRSYF